MARWGSGADHFRAWMDSKVPGSPSLMRFGDQIAPRSTRSQLRSIRSWLIAGETTIDHVQIQAQGETACKDSFSDREFVVRLNTDGPAIARY